MPNDEFKFYADDQVHWQMIDERADDQVKNHIVLKLAMSNTNLDTHII